MQPLWQFKTKNFTVQWLIEEDILITEHMDANLAGQLPRPEPARGFPTKHSR
jgi:hypothetical protein